VFSGHTPKEILATDALALFDSSASATT